jgi:hypothetical protein
MFILAFGPVWEPVAWTLVQERCFGMLRRQRIEQWKTRMFSEADDS